MMGPQQIVNINAEQTGRHLVGFLVGTTDYYWSLEAFLLDEEIGHTLFDGLGGWKNENEYKNLDAQLLLVQNQDYPKVRDWLKDVAKQKEVYMIRLPYEVV